MRLLIELKGKNSLKALRDLEEKDLIKILKEPDLNSYSFPGEPISEEDYKKWCEYGENLPAVSLIEAKQKWEDQTRKIKRNCKLNSF